MDPTSQPASHSQIKSQRRQQLEQQLRFNPTDREAFLELGAIYRAESRPLEAKRVLTQAHDLFPEDMIILWELEEAALAHSLRQFREFTELAKRLQTAEADREVERSSQDWAQRRIRICGERIKRDPTLLHLHLARAEALMDIERYEDAVTEVQPILQLDEYSAAAQLIVGRAWLALGKRTEAMTALRAASLRRAVVAPVRVRVAALRLLCETARQMSVELTLNRYRESLLHAEQELAHLLSMQAPTTQDTTRQ